MKPRNKNKKTLEFIADLKCSVKEIQLEKKGIIQLQLAHELLKEL